MTAAAARTMKQLRNALAIAWPSIEFVITARHGAVREP